MSDPEDLVISRASAAAFQAAASRIVDAGTAFKRRDKPVLDRDLARADVEFAITDDGEHLDVLVDWLERAVFPGSLNFAAPSFLAHPDTGSSVAGVLGDLANAFLSQNLSSRDYSPIATPLEQHLLGHLRQVVGFPPCGTGVGAGSHGGGIVFGGSQANFAGLLAAREHLREKVRSEKRLFDPRRTRVLANRSFTHFSLRRSLHLLGLGNADCDPQRLADEGLSAESLLEVGTKELRTDPADLEKRLIECREAGEDVMAIFAVAGDSRYMTFDDLVALAKIADQHDVWLHVDACEGGQVLFSPNTRHLMAGVERCDSVSLDPHKILAVPYNVSAFVLRRAHDLGYFSTEPTRLISQDDDSLGGYTPGINSKAFISLKLILMLRHWGWRRIADEVDRRHDLAMWASQRINAEPSLRLLNPRVEHNAVGFVYLPEAATPLQVLNETNRIIHQRVNVSSDSFIHGFPCKDDHAVVSPDRGSVYALRMMFGNPLTTTDHIEGLLSQVLEIGSGLERSRR